jgi:hypothetical protein
VVQLWNKKGSGWCVEPLLGRWCEGNGFYAADESNIVPQAMLFGVLVDLGEQWRHFKPH